LFIFILKEINELGMQGKKVYSPKLFVNFNLSDQVPVHNFYRRLKDILNLDFLYLLTKDYYGKTGQKSIDPTVFFKLSLVAYLENIVSDRQLVKIASMRLDILYFLDYDIDESLPWHSTISRTRQKLPRHIYEEVFNQVLSLCVQADMVTGEIQSIDAAHIKANASLDSLEKKIPKEKLSLFIKEVYQENNDKTDDSHQYIDVAEKELKAIRKRQENSNERLRRKNSANYTNKTHYSKADQDARLSRKRGTSLRLNYTANISVDSEYQVITNVQADYSDKKDSQTLQRSIKRLQKQFLKQNLSLKTIITDAGYSSGDNYRFLEEMKLDAYIPPHGKYKVNREGFIYNKESDIWTCQQGKTLNYITTHEHNGIKMKRYRAKTGDCRECPVRESCIGKKSNRKSIDITIYKEEYDRMLQKLETKKAKYYKKLRMSTVEPAFGTLKNYLGLRRINSKGIDSAHKVMTMSSVAYNLKKLMKFMEKEYRNVFLLKMEQYKSSMLRFLHHSKIEFI
jgi:transposase